MNCKIVATKDNMKSKEKDIEKQGFTLNDIVQSNVQEASADYFEKAIPVRVTNPKNSTKMKENQTAPDQILIPLISSQHLTLIGKDGQTKDHSKI